MFIYDFKLYHKKDESAMGILLSFDPEFKKCILDNIFLFSWVMTIKVNGEYLKNVNPIGDKFYTTPTFVFLKEREPGQKGSIAEINIRITNNYHHHPIPGRVTEYTDRWECGPGDLWVPEDRSSKRFKKEFLELIDETSKALYLRGGENVCETSSNADK